MATCADRNVGDLLLTFQGDGDLFFPPRGSLNMESSGTKSWLTAPGSRRVKRQYGLVCLDFTWHRLGSVVLNFWFREKTKTVGRGILPMNRAPSWTWLKSTSQLRPGPRRGAKARILAGWMTSVGRGRLLLLSHDYWTTALVTCASNRVFSLRNWLVRILLITLMFCLFIICRI